MFFCCHEQDFLFMLFLLNLCINIILVVFQYQVKWDGPLKYCSLEKSGIL